MDDRITTSSVYREHEKIALLVEKQLKNKKPTLRYCKDIYTYKRITQEFIRITAEEYAEYRCRNSGRLNNNINLKYFYINTKTGKFKINFKFFIKSIFVFFSVWAYFLFFILLSMFYKRKNSKNSATFLFDSPANIKRSDKEFVNFCKNGKITPLREYSSIIIRTSNIPKTQTNNSFIKYTQQHPIAYCINNYLNIKQSIYIFIKHLTAPFYYFKSIINSPCNVLISKDIAIIKIAKFLNDNNFIESIVITTSTFQSQPIWMNGLNGRNFKLHMLWYSQNFIPKVYVGEIESSNLPGAKYINVDEHWVWTNGFANYLSSIGQTNKINIVDPILWFLKESNKNIIASEVIKVVLFDIMPVKLGNKTFASVNNYYTVDLMKKFITDITSVCNYLSKKYNKKIKVLLKHKRPINKKSCAIEYIEYIDKLVNNGDIDLLDSSVNTFSVIEESCISFSIPYTSTAYVASYLKKPSIYYDPFSDIVPIFDKNEFIDFASEYKELKNITEKTLIYSLK